MSNNNTLSDNKKALLDHKAKILENIKYYERRIQDFRADNSPHKLFYEDSCSSDSEDDFPTYIDNGPSVQQLKKQEDSLRTCLQATQELTSLEVLQSEINVMVRDPTLDGEAPVPDPGIWREVVAECRIDLVPFSIMFYVHQATRDFAPLSFRKLKVLPAKSSHETELAKSVLSTVSRPSDAIEVLRSYATPFRSRRTTLARLASKFPQSLFMEPMVEGGFQLKCPNLEVSWRLESKSSPVANFQHKMKFDLEYVDQSFLQIITQAHKQLSDPTITTEQRTLLLTKIITTCLEAQGTQEQDESIESETESIKENQKQLNTVEKTPPAKKNKEPNEDDQIMAPPKSLPKKTKPKGKENVVDNRKSVKRSHFDEGGSSKKAKIDGSERRGETDEKQGEKNDKRNDNEMESDGDRAENDKQNVLTKNKSKPSVSQRLSEKEPRKITEKIKDVKNAKRNPTTNVNTVQNKEKVNPNEVKEKTRKNAPSKESEQKAQKEKLLASSKNPKTKEIKDVASKNSKNQKDENVAGKNRLTSAKNDLPSKNTVGKDGNTVASSNNPKVKESAIKNVASKENKKHNPNTKTGNTDSDKKLSNIQMETAKKVSSKVLEQDKPIAKNIQTEKTKGTNKNTEKIATNLKNPQNNTKKTLNLRNSFSNKPNLNPQQTTEKAVKVNHVAAKNKEHIANREPANIASTKNVKNDDKFKKTNIIKNLSHKNPAAHKKMQRLSSEKIFKNSKPGSTGKENGAIKTSKIPQKKLSPVSERAVNRNHFRLSPRKITSTFKSVSDTNVHKLQKPTTNIPRLMKKPVPKPK